MTIVWFILGLSVLIFIHELGHFSFAKLFNVYVYEFSLFMGPKIFQKKGKETKYTLRCLPIGGYCSMAGEQDQQAARNEKELTGQTIKDRDGEPLPEVPFERTINGVSWIKKFIILFAGPFFNIILCFLILLVYYGGTGKVDTSNRVYVSSGTIFETAGVKTDDRITALTGTLSDGTTYTLENISTFAELSSVLEKTNPRVDDANAVGKTQCLDLTILRDGNTLHIDNVCRTFTTYTVTTAEDGTKAVTEIAPVFGFRQTTMGMTVGEVISSAAKMEVKMGILIYQALGGLFKKGGINNVSGIVGMYESAVVFANQGVLAFLFYFSMISVNLGIINLLPLPALDGGRLLFMIIEKISGRKIDSKVEAIINGVGFIILICLILLVTAKDLFF